MERIYQATSKEDLIFTKKTFFVFSVQVMIVFELQEGPLEVSRIQF